MARLPDVGALGARPTPQPNRPFASYDGGGRVAAAVGQLGRVVGKIAEDGQREQDAAAVFAARRQLDDWERGAIFDKDNGAVNRLGRDAFGVPVEIERSFDEVAGKVAEGLTSDRQRRAFDELATARRAQVLDWANKHATREKGVFEAGQFKADLDSMADRAALFPDRAAGELAIARERIVGFMKAKGRSTEEIGQAIKENESRVHAGVIGGMLNAGNGEAATEYLKANRGSMTADAILRSEASLKEVTARGRAQAFADDAMARGLKADDALREAREKFSGIDEDAVVREVKTRFVERDAIEAQQQKDASDSAWKVITNGGGRKNIAPELWNSLSGTDQRQINDYVDAKWRRAKADAKGDDIDDVQAYYGLRLMAANEPAAFASIDMMRLQPSLSKQNFSRLVELRAGINKGEAKTMELGQVTGRALKMIDQEVRAAGIDMTPKEGSKQAKQAAAFKSALVNALDAAAAEKNGRLTDKEAREIGLGLLREGIEQGSGFFGFGVTKKRAFEMDPGKTYVAKPYDEIPGDIRQALEAELPPERGIYGNSRAREQQIERMYQRGLELGRFR